MEAALTKLRAEREASVAAMAEKEEMVARMQAEHTAALLQAKTAASAAAAAASVAAAVDSSATTETRVMLAVQDVKEKHAREMVAMTAAHGKEIAALNAAHEAAMADDQKTIETLEKEVAELVNQIREIQEEREAFEEQVREQLLAEFTEKEERLTSAQQTAQQELAAAKTTACKAEAQVARVEELALKCATLEDKNTELRKQMQLMRDNHELALDRIRREASDPTAQFKPHADGSGNSAKQNLIANLQATIRDKDEEIARLNRQLRNVRDDRGAETVAEVS